MRDSTVFFFVQTALYDARRDEKKKEVNLETRGLLCVDMQLLSILLLVSFGLLVCVNLTRFDKRGNTKDELK